MSEAYENRFRDPAFIKVWERRRAAALAWEEAWWNTPLGTPRYFEAGCPNHPEAQESHAANLEYKACVRRLLAS